MPDRNDSDYDHDIYGDPTAEVAGMGWVGMTPEQRAAYREPPHMARLIENLERVIDGWGLE